MKNKSAHHKSCNTFKFQLFSERIANIDIDIFHRVGHRNEESGLETHESVFYISLDKWEVLNLSESYNSFRKEIKPQSLVTLPQVLHEQQHIVDTLIRHIELKNILCLQPLLEHVLAVAKDLGIDFYQYYSCFFTLFLDLLNTKDVEVIEWTFHCLAYLFKFLWRQLIRDIDKVFGDLLPLLSDYKPDYIINFASESFAFIARKVKDRKSFLNLIIKSVKHHKEGNKGSGRLLFHAINGINGQLHSCSESFLPFLIDSLLDYSGENQAILFDILEQIFLNITLKIHPQRNNLFWNIVVNSFDKFIKIFSTANTDHNKRSQLINLNMLLTLVCYSVEYKNGRFLKDPFIIIRRLITILSFEGVDVAEIHLGAIKVSLLLLNGSNIKLQQEHANNLTLKILSLSNKSNILYFIDNVHESSVFDVLNLTKLLKICCDDKCDKDTLYTLTKFIIKRIPMSFDGINLPKWNRCLKINQQSNEQSNLLNYLKNMLIIRTISDLLNNMGSYICATIILPHISGNKDEVITLLHGNIQKLCEEDLKQNNEADTQMLRILFLMNFTVQCLIREQEAPLTLDIFNILMNKLLPLCQNGIQLVALRTVDLILTRFINDDSIMNMKNLENIHEYLQSNFNSPYNEVRILTTHIYSLFESLLQEDQSDSNEAFKIFTICYRVEAISPQVDTYREQLYLLDNLSADKTRASVAKNTKFAQIPLKYLCGVLYFNFKLLWDPVLKIIATYAEAMDMTMFWHIFGEELRITAKNINNNVINENSCEFGLDFLNKFMKEGSRITSKPDYTNYRMLLWKAMELFPNVAEAKTRDVSELFLTFFEEEYSRAAYNSGIFCNIKQNSPNIDTDQNSFKSNLDDAKMVTENIENDLKDYETTHISKNGSHKVRGKNILKTLLQHLSLFSKVRSPLSMYRERELYSIYTELLSHKNHHVQKLALSCLFCYKSKHLSPYNDHLYNLIDPNLARNELTTFKINVDGGIIAEEHRSMVIPVIIRLAFSKLTLKVGCKGHNWRGLVVRFVGGCTSEEMLEFVRMTFRQYTLFLEESLDSGHKDCSVLNILEQLTKVSETVDLTRLIHPKRLISTLNLLQVIFDTGGLLTDNILRFLLQIILVISSLIHGVYCQKPFIHAGYLSILRLVKNQCQKSIGHFFEHFYSFSFLRQELLSIFQFTVWPYISKIPIEGVHSPTTLLRLLLHSWGSHPRFFPLLNLRNLDGMSVMPFVMELLMNAKSNASVVNDILDMVQRLLTLEYDKVNGEGEELDVVEGINERVIPCNTANLNYGSRILLPHVHQIMDKIGTKLASSKSKIIGPRDLSILSRISELVTEEVLCNQLLEILLPICIRKCSTNTTNEERIQQLLRTVKNLLRHVEDPSKHIRTFSQLFGIVGSASCRKIICETLKELMISNSKEKEWINISNLVLELNAFDSKWIDQPDFQRRLDGFKQINKIVEDDHIPTDMGILVIHNCFYLITIEKDLSLRDSATNCIKIMTPKLLDENPIDNKYIIDDTLFSLLRGSLKYKQDDVRAECIAILGYLARTCPKHHVVLRDLKILTNSEDPEVDFFENITHLQVFRQGRALVKFTQIFKLQTQAPCSRTLTQFILPLITHYLCNDRYASKNNIVDGAIDAVGIICRLLPWHQYEALLRYYLAKLRNKVEFQKQLVRLIVAILDSFHFDLSKVQETNDLGDLSDIKDSENKRDGIDVDIAEVHEKLDSNDVELPSSDLDEPFEELLTKPNVSIVTEHRITTLCKSAATRIIFTIKNILLPQLHRTLAELSSHEEAHKVNRSKYNAEREDDDLLRVPISLAVVKLLQKLPKEILEANLPGVLMKLCSFLRSPLESVRRCTRETLMKIMISLTPNYLAVLLDCITPLLSRGFQSHVLVYTIHAVLSSLREQFKYGDINCILDTVNKLCMADLFGALAEEKDIGKIGSKTSEAKSTKSFDTLQMLAQYLTENHLLNVILPLKDVLMRTHSHKIISKIRISLRHISEGFIQNTFITNESLLAFCYGVSSENIPQLQIQISKPPQSAEERSQSERFPESCLIISKAPERHSSIFKTARVTDNMNNYILVEFGLNVCYLMLKRDKLREEHGKDSVGNAWKIRGYLDPFVAVFDKCLTSNHVKLCTIAMQCLNWIIKYDLPSMKDNLNNFIKSIFAILHKYAATGLSKGDNFDLVIATFKTISTFLRHTNTSSNKMVTLSNDQLALLLIYVEQDLHSSDRQVTAFHLLRAILTKRPLSPPVQLHDVLLKAAELSVRSEQAHVRSQARSCVHQYMIEFPIGKKKLDSMIGWYVNQLSYDIEPGRLVVIETLDGLVYAIPQAVLKKYSGTLLMTLGARLINDESPECRKNIATIIITMFKKLSKEDMNELFDIIIIWFKDDKVPTRQLAAQLISLLISVEKDDFEQRLVTITPIILAQICPEISKRNSPGRHVKIQTKPIVTCSSDEDNTRERILDHYIFQLLKMLQKLAAHCPKFLQDVELIDSISTEVQTLLGHAHEWVRLGAAQFLGYILATVDVQKLVTLLLNDVDVGGLEDIGYLYSNPREQIKSLTLDLCAQLQPGDIRSELAEQIIKNLVFLAQVLQHIPISKDGIKQVGKCSHLIKDKAEYSKEDGNEDDPNGNVSKAQINLMFLTKRMRKIVNSEIVETPSKTTLRTEVFKWIGAISKTLNISSVRFVLHHLMAPLIREMNTSTTSESEQQDHHKDLRLLANDVAKIIKNRVGIELYTETVARVQRTLMQRRAERKRGRTQLALTHSEAFAKKKLRRHEKKREAKKRKVATMKGEFVPKKRRHINFDDNRDVM